MGSGTKVIDPQGLTPISEIDLRLLSRTGDPNDACPACCSQMQALSLEELYGLVEKTGAEVMLVRNDAFLESVGDQGAILRY